MGRAKRTLVALAFTLVSCSTQVVPAATPVSSVVTLRVYATTATAPLLYDLTTAYRQFRPHIVIEIATANYRTLSERVAGEEGAYFFSHHLPDDIDSPTTRFWAAPVGQDALTILVNSANPVANLTLDQMRDVFAGRIQHWGLMGGREDDVIVVTREAGSGIRAEFETLVMGDIALASGAQIAPGHAAMIESIARQSAAIGYGSLSDRHDSVRTLAVNGVPATADTVYDRTYPLRTTLYIVGRAEPMEDYAEMRAFIGWIQSPAGQRVVGQRYVPLLRP